MFEVQINVISCNFEGDHFYEVQDYNKCIHQINIHHLFSLFYCLENNASLKDGTILTKEKGKIKCKEDVQCSVLCPSFIPATQKVYCLLS